MEVRIANRRNRSHGVFTPCRHPRKNALTECGTAPVTISEKNSLAARGGMGQGWTGTFEQLAEYLVKL
jgi:uncharacterized protein YndB with AHSA1/START domain